MDDLLPNDGAMFDPSSLPEELEKENREYISKAESSYPVINDLIEDFENDINEADSISKSGLYHMAESTPQQAQIMFEANRKYVEKLNTKLEALKAMRDVVKQ